MAWVRIHDGALSHPKLVGLIDWKNPFCLWVWGLSYCQMHLTDGLIPKAALPHPLAVKTAAKLVEAKTWDTHALGFTVHDYLDWNDSKELVTRKRGEAKERMANARQRSSREHSENEQRSSTLGRVILGSGSSGKESSGKLDPFTHQPTADRAASFIDRYQVLYQQHRKGARYAVKPARDYAAAVTLCDTWPDDRLEKLAIIFLTTDHHFAEEGSRTIPQFLALASWADGKLAEHEAKKGSAA